MKNLNEIVREALNAANVKLSTNRGGRIRTDKLADGSRVCRVSAVMSNYPDEASKFLPAGYKFERVPSTNKKNTWVLVEC